MHASGNKRNVPTALSRKDCSPWLCCMLLWRSRFALAHLSLCLKERDDSKDGNDRQQYELSSLSFRLRLSCAIAKQDYKAPTCPICSTCLVVTKALALESVRLSVASFATCKLQCSTMYCSMYGAIDNSSPSNYKGACWIRGDVYAPCG